MVQATDFRENSFKAIQEIKVAILRVVSISSNLFVGWYKFVYYACSI